MAARQVLVLVLMLVAVTLSACDVTDVTPPASDQPAASPPSPTATALPSASAGPPAVQVDTLTQTSQGPAGPGAYRYHVEVPRLTSATAHLQGVDGAIRGALQRAVNDFLDGVGITPAGPNPSDLTCTSRTVRLTILLAVLRVDCSQYLSGAARPTTSTQTFNCDLAGDRVLRLQDLFGSGSGYLQVLSAAAKSQAHGSGQTLADATAPVVDNFKAFLLDGSALVVLLTNAGTSPAPEISVPYRDLQRYFASSVSALLPS